MSLLLGREEGTALLRQFREVTVCEVMKTGPDAVVS